MTEYAIEWDNGKSGILVKAEDEAKALEIAWEYRDLRIEVGFDRKRLSIRVIREIEDK